MGIGKLKMAVHIPCLNVLVTVILIMIVQVTLFVISVSHMRLSLDVVEENNTIQRLISASVQMEVMVLPEMLEEMVQANRHMLQTRLVRHMFPEICHSLAMEVKSCYRREWIVVFLQM
jgi:hypothetical protein